MYIFGTILQMLGGLMGMYLALAIGLGATDRMPVERYDILIVLGIIAAALYYAGTAIERLYRIRARVGGRLCA